MRTITLQISLTYDDDIYHSKDSDQTALEWFRDEILLGDNLCLHDSDVGDFIGAVKVIDMDFEGKEEK